MSIRHTVAAWDVSSLSPSEKLVLLFLAWKANEANGYAYPSVDTVVTATGIKERQVRTILAELRTKGLIVPTTGTVGGRGKTTVYSVVIAAESVAVKGAVDNKETLQSAQRKGAVCDMLAPERVQSSVVNPAISDIAIRKKGFERQDLKIKPDNPLSLTGQGEPLWTKARVQLAREMQQQSYETWIKPLRFLGVDGRTLVLSIPVPEFSHVASKWGAEIVGAAKKSGMEVEGLRLVVLQ